MKYGKAIGLTIVIGVAVLAAAGIYIRVSDGAERLKEVSYGKISGLVRTDLGEFGMQPIRGEILTADGETLSHSVKTWNVYLDPKTVATNSGFTLAVCIDRVAGKFALPKESVAEMYARTDSRFLRLASDVTEEQRLWGEGSEGKRAGLVVLGEQRRECPSDTGADGFLGTGYIGEDGCLHGSSGLERSLDKYLAGTPGKFMQQVSGGTGRGDYRLPVRGGTAKTTIDSGLQRHLSSYVRETFESNRAENAWGVVVKIPMGEILAIASETSPGDGKSAGNATPRNNLAEMTFMPTQLMNPLTCAIALNEGVVHTDSVIEQSDGEWRFKGRSLRDRVKDPVTVRDALRRRADIAVAKLALEIGKDRMTSYVRKLGFGAKTSEGDFPRESSGGLWDPETIDDYGIAMAGIGGYFLVTPMQIAKAYATLGNHGVEVKPYVVSEVRDAEGAVVRRHVPDAEPKRVFSRQVADYIVGILPGVSGATPMYKDRRFSYVDYVASYVGFYPAVNPEYVTLIGLSKPKGKHKGMEVAFPVFLKMLPFLKMREEEKKTASRL